MVAAYFNRLTSMSSPILPMPFHVLYTFTMPLLLYKFPLRASEVNLLDMNTRHICSDWHNAFSSSLTSMTTQIRRQLERLNQQNAGVVEFSAPWRSDHCCSRASLQSAHQWEKAATSLEDLLPDFSAKEVNSIQPYLRIVGLTSRYKDTGELGAWPPAAAV